MTHKRIHNPYKSYSADASRVSKSNDQDGHHTHIWLKPHLLGPMTVLVDSQVSDRCRWATCCFTARFERFSVFKYSNEKLSTGPAQKFK